MTQKSYNILLVDDDEVVLQALEVHLADLPHTVISTHSPAKAIGVLGCGDIAVLICDLNMPGIDGNTVLAEARKRNPDIVSIILTGGADQAVMIDAINRGGIWKFIMKPWKRDDLVTAVIEAVERYARLCEPRAQLKEIAEKLSELSQKEEQLQHTTGRQPKRIKKKKAIRLRVVEKEDRPDLQSDRYELQEVLGEGQAGIVYKAQDTLLNMPVAIKVLSPSLSRKEFWEQSLKDEARIAMQLSHRHIVRLHNLQRSGDRMFLVMEHVEGHSFREVIVEYGAFPIDGLPPIAQVFGDAISYAHRHGVIHGDLKPENILLTGDGVLKIIDFGIASLTNAKHSTGLIAGTPAYMSPEQKRGELLDTRTDIYSLGIIIYELLTSRNPFPEDMSTDEVLNSMPGPLVGLPHPVTVVLEKAIAADRDDRWRSAGEFTDALVAVVSSLSHGGINP